MGLSVVEQMGSMRFPNTQYEYSHYDPLHDDAQAMALVKKLNLSIYETNADGEWCVFQIGTNELDTTNSDLNRAICECVAKMEKK